MLKVLFLVRPDLFKIKAGDTIQITHLKSSLNNHGIKVELSFSQQPELDSFDLVHCFNLLRVEVSLGQCRYVKEMGKPLVFTPIYWNLEEYLKNIRPDQLNWWYKGQKKRKKLLKLVDLLATNAEGEWRQIKRDFGVDLPYCIIHNGVDPMFFSENKITRRDRVLAVGRIHSRKNQLGLIRALKGTGLPLVLIGDVNDPSYYRNCLNEAEGEDVAFYKGMEMNKLVSFYQKAKVHVLASWYDTPGLVNLEAGLAGCNLVSTDRGTAYEYLKDFAYYCDPTDLKQIRSRVLQAYHCPCNNDLSHYILDHFTWDKIARETIEIYNEFLSRFI